MTHWAGTAMRKRKKPNPYARPEADPLDKWASVPK